MVLVAYKPRSNIGILQTTLSNREGHEARRGGLETMPLDQHIEGGHGERQARLNIRPAPMHHLFAVADECQHGEHRLHEHPVLPRAALTQFQVGGIAFRGMQSRITQDNHLFFNLANEPLKGVIRDIGRVTCPPHDQPPLIEQQTEFAADNPAMIGEPFAADLLRAAAFAHGVNQLDPIGVDDPEHSRGGQEDPRPVLMGPEETKEPGTLGKSRKQRPRVARQPAIKRPVAHAFQRM